jgi:hypothetical protein
MAWNDMRKPDKIPAVFDTVEKLLTENELAESRRGGLSRPEMAMESYPETGYTLVKRRAARRRPKGSRRAAKLNL